MIYDYPPLGTEIRQGDIFYSIPKVDLSLTNISVLNAANEAEEADWDALRQSAEPIAAIVGITPVSAIVITQDCDTVRAPDITLCEIKKFGDVIKVTPPTTPKKWGELIRTQAAANLKWFYLPPDPDIGFTERMAVDFQTALRIPREDLEGARHLRKGRLNATADEHFRERLAEFFRRYPYNEWYPFSKDEFDAYRAGHAQEQTIIVPYDYQQ